RPETRLRIGTRPLRAALTTVSVSCCRACELIRPTGSAEAVPAGSGARSAKGCARGIEAGVPPGAAATSSAGASVRDAPHGTRPGGGGRMVAATSPRFLAAWRPLGAQASPGRNRRAPRGSARNPYRAARAVRVSDLAKDEWQRRVPPFRSPFAASCLTGFARARSSAGLERRPPEPKVRGSNPLGRTSLRRAVPTGRTTSRVGRAVPAIVRGEPSAVAGALTPAVRGDARPVVRADRASSRTRLGWRARVRCDAPPLAFPP